MSERRLEEKTVVVTGAANGMGACEAQLFAKHGANVVATDIDGPGVQCVADEITATGGHAIAVRHDVSIESDWARVIDQTGEAFGTIDALVNNAAVYRSGRLLDITRAAWDGVLDVDLTGTFLGIRAVLPQMIEQRSGAIISIASIAAKVGGSFAHYSAAKGGVCALTRTTAIEYGRFGIRVNAILPGIIETRLTHDILADADHRRNLARTVALPRFGRPEDIAYCALYLVSDESSFVTGAEFIVDGGSTAM